MKNINWKKLITAILIPLLTGTVAALISMNGMKDFPKLTQPVLSPPMWIFPFAWTILYTLMGISSYLVDTTSTDAESRKSALWIYGIQLLLNFLWTIIFFNFGQFWLAFIWLIALWIAILICTIRFYKINPTSGWLLVPYLIWVAFALYLNLSIAILN